MMDNNDRQPEINALSPNAEKAVGLKSKILPTLRDRLFFLVTLASCFTLFDFALGRSGIGVSVYFIGLYLLTALYLWPWKVTDRYAIACGALGIIVSVSFSFSVQLTVTFFSIIAAEYLYMVFACGVSDNCVFGNGTVSFIKDASRAFFSDSIEEIGAVFRTGKEIKDGGQLLKNIFKCALGIVIAVPLLCIVLPLLSAADGAFESFLDKLFEFELGFDFSHLIFAMMLCPLTCGMLFSLKHKKAEIKYKTEEFSKPRGIDPMVTAGFLGVLSLCYLLYVYSQLGYFFSAFGGSIPDTVKTAASYARRGFFELCIISLINFAAIAVALFKTRAEGAYRVCKWFSLFISLFSIMLIGTALSKMLLYIKLYGLTVRRMLPSVFMLLLILAFVLLIRRIFKGSFNYMRIFATACAVTLAVMNFVDISALSADYNAEMYLNTDAAWHIDSPGIDYLRSLGDAGVPALVRIASEAEDESVRRAAASSVERIYNDLVLFDESEGEKAVRNWRDVNITTYRADKAFKEYFSN